MTTVASPGGVGEVRARALGCACLRQRDDPNSSDSDPDSTRGGLERRRVYDLDPRTRLERDGEPRSPGTKTGPRRRKLLDRCGDRRQGDVIRARGAPDRDRLEGGVVGRLWRIL